MAEPSRAPLIGSSESLGVRARRVAGLLWRAGRWLSVLWAVLVVATAAMPIVCAFAFAQVIGSVPDAAGTGLGSAEGHRLVAASLAASGVFLLGQVVSNLMQAVNRVFGRRVEAQIQFEALEATGRIDGLADLEHAQVRDALYTVRDVETAIHPAAEVVRSIQQIGSGVLLSLAAATLLALFHWWIPPLLMSGWMLQDLWCRRQYSASTSLQDQTEHTQRYEAYRSLALEAPAAKELRIFGLGGWVSDRAEREWREAMAIVWRGRKVPWVLPVSLFVVQSSATALVFWLIVRAGATGEIGLDRVALYLQATLGPVMSLYQPYAVIVLRQAMRPLRSVAFLSTALRPPHDRGAPSGAGAAGPADVRVEGLRFRYPGAPSDVLEGIDLHIPAGRSVAIVGENGAGKTTLVKLLSRLYEPTAGTIDVDGAPLATIDPAAWRQRIGVVFQDFVHYPLTLRENVGFGRTSADTTDEDLAYAAHGASLEPIAAALPHGWDTLLARELGGTDLSGGEWQRVALARALFSVRTGAGLLILDEPTASLDVRAEVELFDRFLDLTQGVTTVLISHRFSTVRRVDLIYVVEHGRVVEQGSHEELLAHGGRYAEMFTLQASRFTTTVADDA